MTEACWTFEPVFPESYREERYRVFIVGSEPHERPGEGWRPDRRDTGLWFRTAPDNANWGNENFYVRTVEQLHAVLATLGVKPDSDRDALCHLRHLDLKATGGGTEADRDQVSQWVLANIDKVAGYWA